MRLPKGIRPSLRQPEKAPRVAQVKRSKSAATTDAFVNQIAVAGLPAPETEVVFAPPRKFRADYHWHDPKLIVEREGGIWAKGRAQAAHARPWAILRDMEKLNLAQALGYRFFRFTPEQLGNGEALALIRPVLETTK